MQRRRVGYPRGMAGDTGLLQKLSIYTAFS